MLQTFDKAIKLHQTACFYNELRGYPYIFCTFLLFLRIKLTNILNYYLYLPQQKTVSSAISIHNTTGFNGYRDTIRIKRGKPLGNLVGIYELFTLQHLWKNCEGSCRFSCSVASRYYV